MITLVTLIYWEYMVFIHLNPHAFKAELPSDFLLTPLAYLAITSERRPSGSLFFPRKSDHIDKPAAWHEELHYSDGMTNSHYDALVEL